MKTIQIKAFNETTLEEQKKAISSLAANHGKFKMIGKIVKAGTAIRDISIGSGITQRGKITVTKHITGIVVLDTVNSIAINVSRELIPELYEENLLDVKIENNLISPKLDATKAFPRYVDINTLLDFTDTIAYVLVDNLGTEKGELYFVMAPGFHNGVGQGLILDKAELVNKFASYRFQFTLANAQILKETGDIYINKPRWIK